MGRICIALCYIAFWSDLCNLGIAWEFGGESQPVRGREHRSLVFVGNDLI